MRKTLFFDESRCTACETCVMACKDWHDLEMGIHWIRVRSFESGKYPRPKVKYRLKICHHCAKPPCMELCPVGAIIQGEIEGFVLVEQSVCIGCLECLGACPFGVPQFGRDGFMEKCDMCFDRVQMGMNPICVDACPNRALSFGLVQEVRKIP